MCRPRSTPPRLPRIPASRASNAPSAPPSPRLPAIRRKAMTRSEKKIFLVGAGTGIALVALVGGVLAARSGHVFASYPAPASSPMQPAAARPATEQSQGTQPGTTVQLTPAEMTAAGVQVAAVKTAVLKTNIDAFGRVEQPESQLAAVSAWIGGRVDKLYVQYTGDRVRRGQRLGGIFSPQGGTGLEEERPSPGPP